jgi:hypothetical protein
VPPMAMPPAVAAIRIVPIGIIITRAIESVVWPAEAIAPPPAMMPPAAMAPMAVPPMTMAPARFSGDPRSRDLRRRQASGRLRGRGQASRE